MKRDRHDRGAASGPTQMGPIYLDEASLGKARIALLRMAFRCQFRNYGADATNA